MFEKDMIREILNQKTCNVSDFEKTFYDALDSELKLLQSVRS